MLEDERLEEIMFPWTRSQRAPVSRGALSMSVSLRNLQKQSMADRIGLYFRIPPEDGQARGSLSTPEINDYEICQVMWDKFGITPVELEQYDSRWVDTMLMILSEDVKSQNERMKR